MKNTNICKFIFNSGENELEMKSFVNESNPEIIRTPYNFHYHRMILVKNGSGVFHFDNKEFEFSTGNLIFSFDNEISYAEFNDVCEYMYISFSGLRSDSLFKRFGITKNNRIFTGFDGLIPIWNSSLSRASKENIDLATEGILLYTFSHLAGFTDNTNNLINDIIKITEARFNDAELSVTTLSEELSYNPKYISHFFKKQMGIGYTEYLRNFRIKYAVSLLDHGIDSVKNIAFLSGFSDPLYFSTVFKKVIGISPKEYKAKNSKNMS